MEKQTRKIIFFWVVLLIVLFILFISLVVNRTEYTNIYRTLEQQDLFDMGYQRGYQEGYNAAKHNLTYGVVYELFNFSCINGKNYSEQINKCIEKQ